MYKKDPDKKRKVVSGTQMSVGRQSVRKYDIIRDVMRKISADWSESDIKEWLSEKYGFVDRQLSTYYQTACAALDFRIEKYANEVAMKNMSRLNMIIDEAEENGNLKIQLDAIDTLNKMAGLYSQKIDINADKPIFEIKIGE